jgi:hypothetical protein
LTIEPTEWSDGTNKGLIIKNNGGPGTVIVDGDLYIYDDIFYSNSAADKIGASLDNLASIGWIVKGNIYINDNQYKIDDVAKCDDYPQNKWCDKYKLVTDNQLTYGTVTVGPEHIVGSFFSEDEIRTGAAQIPLTVEGSLIGCVDVVLQRREFPKGE